MLETARNFQSIRIHGDDRWLYTASKARRNPSRGQRSAGARDRPFQAPDSEKGREVPDNRARMESSCNLDRFLEITSLSVPAQYPPKIRTREWKNCGAAEFCPYFALVDLWESFRECSAYGVGVPLVLNGGENVVQYYVPYLSGMQLYGDSIPDTNDRQFDECDGDTFRDSSSDRSSDCGREETTRCLSEDGDSGNPHGHLIFEYLEQDPPFIREPLADKLADLAQQFPVLKNLKSCDLLPSSWISVAWYPIYRIPTGPTLKDLDACFLTFHTLSTGMKDASCPIITYPKGVDAVPMVSLPTFGLASYKFKSSIWTPNGRSALLSASSLLQAADNWLRLLNVNHPDYKFFVSHGYGRAV